MKKTLTFLLLTFMILGCSSSEDDESNSDLIIGKWNLESQFLSDGTNKNIDDCEKMSNVTFKVNNTFDLNNYRAINGDCTLEDVDTNVEYSIENKIMEIIHTSIHNGQTIIDVSKVKINFPNSDTLETFGVNEDGTISETPADIWKREN